jgi:hypothetical protein
LASFFVTTAVGFPPKNAQVLHQFDLAFVVETMHDADAMANGAAMIGVEVFNHTTEAKVPNGYSIMNLYT